MRPCRVSLTLPFVLSIVPVGKNSGDDVSGVESKRDRGWRVELVWKGYEDGKRCGKEGERSCGTGMGRDIEV